MVKFQEYSNRRAGLSITGIFEYFIYFYGNNWVYNPKQARRALVNMEELYYYYKNLPVVESKIQDEIVIVQEVLIQPSSKGAPKKSK